MNGIPWSTKDLDTLSRMIDGGYSYDAIARRLQRTHTAVVVKSTRLKYRLLSSGATLSARDVADLLGLGCSKTVARWIDTYGLKARNGGSKDKPLWRVQWDDLCNWLDAPDHWMAYDPMRCTDRVWRDHLVEMREGQPRWLTPTEAAKHMSVERRCINKWIHNGDLPAVRYGNWWIRESALENWTPPYERSYAGVPKRVIENRHAVVAYIREQRAAGEHLATIAATTGVSVSTVHRLATQVLPL